MKFLEGKMEHYLSTDTKLSVLSKVAKSFNEADITWAVGASLLLYFQGGTEDFHDIDIVVSEEDALRMRSVLLKLGQEQETNSDKNFRSKYFWKFQVDEVEIDVMGGLVIIKEGKEYYCPLLVEEITGTVMVNGVSIPLHSIERWRYLYELMGRREKAEWIEYHCMESEHAFEFGKRQPILKKERFDKQVQFILEADKEKNILRQTHLSGNGRRENDAEHAWHMAMMAYLLKEYANEKIDIAKTMMMILIHDIVEIDAGDTYAYDENGLKTQKEREEKAAERIFGLLPEDQCKELRGLFEEFEAYETPEACFAHTMDNFQPMLLNDSNGGGDWKNHGVCEQQVRKRNAKTHTGSEQIWTYMEQMIKKHVAEGNLKS